jgi:hypothetical protein
MEQTADKTHWKKLVNPNYIGAYSMPTDGSNIVLTIKNVVREAVTGEGGKKEECTVAYFQEDSKPMILNRTNCKAIAAAYKTPYIEEWAGLKIEITVANVKVAGEVVEALRILPKVPTKPQKIVMIKDSEPFKKAVAYVKSGNTLANVKEKYDISPEVEKAITDAAAK